MDKKFIFIAGGGLLFVVIMVIVLIVISKPSKAPTVSQAKSLVIWDYNNEKSAYDAMITDFQRENNIKVQYVQRDPGTYLIDTVDAMASGKGPDVWIVPADILPKYKDKLTPMPTGKIADPENKKNDAEVFQDRYPKAVSQNNIIGDKIYGTPLSIDTLKVFYNSSLLSETIQQYQKDNPDKDLSNYYTMIQNGPKTWDDLLQMVKFFTVKSGDKIAKSVIALGTADNVNNFNDVLTAIMLQDGVKMVSDDLSTAQFHTRQNLFGGADYPGAKAVSFYTSFSNPQSSNYTWNKSMPNSIRAFSEGKTAMIIDYESAKEDIKIINPDLNYQTVNLPQVKETRNPVNYAKYDTLTVPKSSKNQALAWNFILKITDPTSNSQYFNVTNKERAQQEFDTNSSIATAQSWYNPDPVQVKTIFKNMIDQVNDNKNAQTALDGAASQVTTLLAKLKQ